MSDNKPLKVLIVDDSRITCKFFALWIQKEVLFDIEVVMTTSTKEAVNLLTSVDFDLVFMDIVLFDLSGFDVVSLAAQKRGADKMPAVIFMSTTPLYFYQEELDVMAERLGRDKVCFLKKPAVKQEVIDCLLRFKNTKGLFSE